MKYILLSVFLIYNANVVAQSDEEILPNDSTSMFPVTLIGKYDGDAVILRWAPVNYKTWVDGKKAGYTITRSELDEDGEVVKSKSIEVLPENMEQITARKDREDPYVLAAANLLLGKEEVLDAPMKQYHNESRIHNMVLVSADLSQEASKVLGLGYRDTDITKGKSYVYKVTSNFQDSLGTYIYSNVIIVDTKELVRNNPVMDISVYEGEQSVQLNWPRIQTSGIHTAYHVERSEDGVTFKRLTELPYTQPQSNKEGLKTEAITYIDSVANYKPYHYRLQGITSYGELTPYSEIHIGMGRDRTPPAPPKITSLTWNDDNTVTITWESEKDAEGFFISRTEMSGQKSEWINKDILDKNLRTFIDKNPDVRYMYSYHIMTIDTAGNTSASLPELAMKPDQEPPSTPLHLKGECDSLGVVTLWWDPSPEEDTRGYHVFLSNHPDHEFARLTSFAHWDTTFVYNTTLKTLDKDLYFKVTSIDYKHNMSEFSKIARVTRPDTIPPNPPVFYDYKVDTSSVTLYWNNSFHKDVKEQIIYRKSLNGQYGVIATLATNIEKYTDTKITQGTTYEYKIEAIDDSGLKSGFASRLELKVPDTSEKGISPLDLKITRMDDKINLEWSNINADKIKIYRKVDNGPLLSYVIIDGNKTGYSDLKIKKGTKYSYSTQVIKGKETSPISKLYSVSK